MRVSVSVTFWLRDTDRHSRPVARQEEPHACQRARRLDAETPSKPAAPSAPSVSAGSRWWPSGAVIVFLTSYPALLLHVPRRWESHFGDHSVLAKRGWQGGRQTATVSAGRAQGRGLACTSSHVTSLLHGSDGHRPLLQMEKWARE